MPGQVVQDERFAVLGGGGQGSKQCRVEVDVVVNVAVYHARRGRADNKTV